MIEDYAGDYYPFILEDDKPIKVTKPFCRHWKNFRNILKIFRTTILLLKKAEFNR
jgi:hypothetical protein